MNELNKKLAEWAGGCVHEWKFVDGKTPPWGRDCVKCGEQYRASQWGYGRHLNEWSDGLKVPNFTESLDACFKWLVPKAIDKLKGDYAIPFIALCRLWYDELVSLAGDSSDTQLSALALCLAIEKLIDGEK